jgi:hypothetical protein
MLALTRYGINNPLVKTLQMSCRELARRNSANLPVSV